MQLKQQLRRSTLVATPPPSPPPLQSGDKVRMDWPALQAQIFYARIYCSGGGPRPPLSSGSVRAVEPSLLCEERIMAVLFPHRTTQRIAHFNAAALVFLLSLCGDCLRGQREFPQNYAA